MLGDRKAGCSSATADIRPLTICSSDGRFHCPYNACGRIFDELWRLKVHYRAPVACVGTEYGHALELDVCNKCWSTVAGSNRRCCCQPRPRRLRGNSLSERLVLGACMKRELSGGIEGGGSGKLSRSQMCNRSDPAPPPYPYMVICHSSDEQEDVRERRSMEDENMRYTPVPDFMHGCMSPPRDPPPFTSVSLLFNFGRFSQLLPHISPPSPPASTSKPMCMSVSEQLSQLRSSGKGSISDNGAMEESSADWLQPDLVSRYVEDDCVHFLFGEPNSFPTMSTVHLHSSSSRQGEEAKPTEDCPRMVTHQLTNCQVTKTMRPSFTPAFKR